MKRKKKGYKSIRDLRQAHGLSTTELAYRLGVNQSSALRLEKSEEKESISLAALKRAAECLGCDLQYEMIPRKEVSIRKRYPGLNRISKESQVSPSKVNQELQIDELRISKALSSIERIERACELSDFTLELNICSKKQSKNHA